MRIHYMHVAYYRALSEIKAEFSSQWFGLLWWVLEPVLYMGAFYIIFAVLGLRGGEDVAPFLLVGLVTWKWFASSVYTGSVSIKRAAGLIQQIYVPKYVLLSVSVLTNFFRFSFIFALLLLFLVFYGYKPELIWLEVIPVILVQSMLVFGVAGLFGALVPFADDLRILVTNGLTLMFFLSGIFFDIGKAPDHLIGLLHLNPMASLIESYRAILLENQGVDWSTLLVTGIFSLATSAVALYLLHRFDRQYPKVLAV